MKFLKTLFACYFLLASLAASASDGPGRWPIEKANKWYRNQPWLVGTNFVPSTAVNQIEMWQEDTFDPETIKRELGWASELGMNTMRVFLHDILWNEDKEGFFKRIDEYLKIADQYGIKTMFVFFDGVWHPVPKAGKQPEPTPHLHNSAWVQSPGKEILSDTSRFDELKPYVQSVLTRYKNDYRVLIWDLFNEPENDNAGSWGEKNRKIEMPKQEKMKQTTELLRRAFAWAREVNPSQPITAGLWGKPTWPETLKEIDRISLFYSDVISFHSYYGPEITQKMVDDLSLYGRPLLCTEYMARGEDSKFENIMPIFAEHKVAAYNWGLVDGKSQTKYPWVTWEKPFTEEPKEWHHDIFRANGKPYSKKEVKFIKKIIKKTNR